MKLLRWLVISYFLVKFSESLKDGVNLKTAPNESINDSLCKLFTQEQKQEVNIKKF